MNMDSKNVFTCFISAKDIYWYVSYLKVTITLKVLPNQEDTKQITYMSHFLLTDKGFTSWKDDDVTTYIFVFIFK